MAQHRPPHSVGDEALRSWRDSCGMAALPMASAVYQAVAPWILKQVQDDGMTG